jgi:hypothetical protein
MWDDFERAYFCIPTAAATLAQQLWTLDSARDFRVNAVAYGVLEAIQWGPDAVNWRNWFRQQFGLTFVLVVPPEDSYFNLNVALWTLIYDEMDAGRFPSYDDCWLLRFPASQGGAWPILWP